MNELALFAGAGGGLLGTKLLGWRTVCAVERAEYCRRVLLARQDDRSLEPFPIWDDVKTFDGRPWAGRVDVVSGGFPCQAFSTASRGRACAEDLWPEMRRVVREVRPRWVFAENVQRSPIERAAADLREDGLRVAFARIGAADVGAPHRRPRWWLVAHADREGQRVRPLDDQVAGLQVSPERLWPEPGPEVLGDDDGVANRMDRLRAIGNGQVPIVAAVAFDQLSRRLEGNK